MDAKTQNRIRRHARMLNLSIWETAKDYQGRVGIHDADGPLTAWSGIKWVEVEAWIEAFLQNPQRELENLPPPVPIGPCAIARYRVAKTRYNRRLVPAALDQKRSTRRICRG